MRYGCIIRISGSNNFFFYKEVQKTVLLSENEITYNTSYIGLCEIIHQCT